MQFLRLEIEKLLLQTNKSNRNQMKKKKRIVYKIVLCVAKYNTMTYFLEEQKVFFIQIISAE